MRCFITNAAEGSVLIGNDLMRYQVNNGYGDGFTYVYVNVNHTDKENLKTRHNVDEWKLEGVTHGTTCIYPYDCLYNHEEEELIPEEPLVTLEGRWAIHSGHGTDLSSGVVLFERW